MEYYVSHRLGVAGYVGDRLFYRSAIDALYRASAGVPRLVNVLAHKAMLAAYGEGRHYVSAAHVRKASQDTPAAHSARSPLAAVGAALFVAVAALVYWFGYR